MNRTTESTVISSTVSYTTAVSTVTEGEDQRTVEHLEQLSDAVLGAIIGGAVVGLILLLILSVATAFCYYKHRRLKFSSQNGSLNAFTYKRQVNDGGRGKALGLRSSVSLPRNVHPEPHDPAPVLAAGHSLRSGLIDTEAVFPVLEEPLRSSRPETLDVCPAEVDSVDRHRKIIRTRDDDEPETAAAAVAMDTSSINSLDADEYNRVIDEAFDAIDNFAFNDDP